VPIFTAGGIGGQVRQAEAQHQQMLLEYEKSIQVAFQEVSDALVSLRKTREVLVVQGRQVEALGRYARLARLRYEAGYTSYLEVVDSERSLFNSQLSQAQTQGSVFASLIQLYKAMGGGWVGDAEGMTMPQYGSNETTGTAGLAGKTGPTGATATARPGAQWSRDAAAAPR
jgi:multidrug efflux system outer membrane protein